MKKTIKVLNSFIKDVYGIFCGKDGKLSGKRIFAIAMTIHFMYLVNRCIKVITDLVEYTTKCEGNINPEAIVGVLSSLGNVAFILGTEAGLIAAFWAFTTYNQIKSDSGTSSTIIKGEEP